MNSTFDQRKAGILLAVLFGAGIVIYFGGQASDKKEQEGKSALYQAQTTYDEELKSLPEAEHAAGTTLDVDAKFPKTIAQLNAILNEKKAPSRVLYEVEAKLGTLYLDHNQIDKAEVVLKKLTTDASSKFQKASAFFLLGVAEEHANQFKDARESYQSGLSSNVDGLKGELMLGMVRMSVKLNDKEKAKLYLEKMNKELANSHATEIAAELVKGTKS